jgi:hypothetical protein
MVAGRMGDDFCIDEDMGVLYLTTHRQNTIDRVSMNPASNSGFTQSVAGDSYMEELIGPSSGIWGRGAGEYGHVAYFVTDGGIAYPPPDGIVRPAKVLRARNSNSALNARLTTRIPRTAASAPTRSLVAADPIPPGKWPISLGCRLICSRRRAFCGFQDRNTGMRAGGLGLKGDQASLLRWSKASAVSFRPGTWQ